MTARLLSTLVSDLREMAADKSGRGNSDLMREAADAIVALTKNQRKGGKARWKRTTKKQRSAAAKAAAEARWKTKKAAGPQNTKVTNARRKPTNSRNEKETYDHQETTESRTAKGIGSSDWFGYSFRK